MFNTYGINTKKKVRQYLAQFMAETVKGDSITEYIYRPGEKGSASYGPFYGAGCAQFTHDYNYEPYSSYKNDPLIFSSNSDNVYATQHVAIAYPADSAGYFWVYCKNIDSLNWSSTDDEYLCREVTNKVRGSSSEVEVSKRYNYYLAICAVLQ